MSNAPPARDASLETVATTSPVVSRARMAGPARAAWCATTWISRKDARSQLSTAMRCRRTPATAWITPRPSSTATQRPSAASSPSARPSSIAWPSANGISAWATIQMIPKSTPAMSVPSLVPADPEQAAARASACPGVPDRRTEARSSPALPVGQGTVLAQVPHVPSLAWVRRAPRPVENDAHVPPGAPPCPYRHATPANANRRVPHSCRVCVS